MIVHHQMADSSRFILIRVLQTASLVALSMTAHPRESGKESINTFLTSQGFAPAVRLKISESDEAFSVLATPGAVMLESTSCMPRSSGPTRFSGKRFSFESEDRGEWGGELKVREGNLPPKILLKGNVIDLVPLDKRLYVFIGSDHLSAGYGAVHVIENYDSRPEIHFVSQLPGTPAVARLDPQWGGFVIISRQSISVLLPGSNTLKILMANHAPLAGANSFLSFGPADMLIGLCGGIAHVHFPWRQNAPPDPYDEIPIVRYWTRK